MLHRQTSFVVAAAALMLLAGGAVAQDPATTELLQSELEAEERARIREFELEQQRLEQEFARQRALEEAERNRERTRQRALDEQAAQTRAIAAREAELEALRTQLEVARRQLEEAARDVATQRLDTGQQSVYRFLSPTAQAGLGLAVVDSPRGVLVTRVTPGSGAAAAGAEAGDIVESINGVALANVTEPSAEFQSRVRSVNPGDRVEIVVDRGGQEVPLSIRAERAPAQVFTAPGTNVVVARAFNEVPAVVRADNPQSVRWTLGLASRLWSDMELVALTEELGRYFSTSEGLLVIRAPSDDEVDIADGDVIQTISGRPPSSPEHAMRILASFEPGETIELAIMRQGEARTVTYALPPADNDWAAND